MSKRKAKEPSYIVPALERGLLLLQAFSKDKPVQSLGILAKELDLPRATTFRLANTLEHLGFSYATRNPANTALALQR